MFEPVNGNYIGLVVNDQDPENRSRVQVYVPNISTTLYSSWNVILKDLSFKSFETQDKGGFNSDLALRLYDLLPWAEGAAPIFGGGTSGIVNPKLGAAIPNPPSESVQALQELPVQTNPPQNGSSEKGNNDYKQVSLNSHQEATPTIPKPLDLGNLKQTKDFSSNLNQFQNFYNTNQSVFQSISEQTLANTGNNIPPALIASIYGRESGAYENPNVGIGGQDGNGAWFQNIKEGSYFINEETPISTDEFISNTVDHLSYSKDKKCFNNINPNDTQSLLNAAKNYNGLGYDNKPGGNPYLFNGTSGYSHGQYDVDHNYDINRTDAHPGVVLMLAKISGNKPVAAYSPTNPKGLNQPVVGYSPSRSTVNNHKSAFLPSGGANGFFSRPAIGSKVWVFFYGGDPMRPVYFANIIEPAGSRVAYQSSKSAG